MKSIVPNDQFIKASLDGVQRVAATKRVEHRARPATAGGRGALTN